MTTNKVLIACTLFIFSEITYALGQGGQTPVPEPETISLLAIGASALAWARNKK